MRTPTTRPALVALGVLVAAGLAGCGAAADPPDGRGPSTAATGAAAPGAAAGSPAGPGGGTTAPAEATGGTGAPGAGGSGSGSAAPSGAASADPAATPSEGASDPEGSTTGAAEPTGATASEAAALVASAADATSRAGSARVRLSAEVVASGTTVLAGAGAFAFSPPKGTFTLTTTAGGRSTTIREVLSGGYAYVQLPATPGQWFRTPITSGTVAGSNPVDSLGVLRSAADVAVVGAETVDGVAATRYRAVVDLAQAVTASGLSAEQVDALREDIARAGARAATVDVWVDGAGRVVRIVQRIALAPSGQPPVRTTTTLRFGDFGVAVRVSVPPASQVVDAPEGMHAVDGGEATSPGQA